MKGDILKIKSTVNGKKVIRIINSNTSKRRQADYMIQQQIDAEHDKKRPKNNLQFENNSYQGDTTTPLDSLDWLSEKSDSEWLSESESGYSNNSDTPNYSDKFFKNSIKSKKRRTAQNRGESTNDNWLEKHRYIILKLS